MKDLFFDFRMWRITGIISFVDLVELPRRMKQRCGTVTIFYGSGLKSYGSGSNF
jgi:hypothetical protein